MKPGPQGSQSTCTDLPLVLEEVGKETRPTYAGSRSAMEHLKRGIIHAQARSESAWQRQRETPIRNRKHLGLSIGTFPATAEHLLLPGLRPKLHFLSWASCLVPWWVPSRNQGATFTPVGSANWAPLPCKS